MTIMTRTFSIIAICLTLTAACLFAQKPAQASFEVASIRPSAPVTPEMVASGKMHTGESISGTRVDIGMLSLTDLICEAYSVKKFQVLGPSWLGAQRFDIVARMPKGSTPKQFPQMLQDLLASRFKLTMHRDETSHRAYALVVAKGGFKGQSADPDLATRAQAAPVSSGSSELSIEKTHGGSVISDGQGTELKTGMSPDGKSMTMENPRMSMGDMAQGLSAFLGCAVIDKTSLRGSYKVKLEFSITDMMNAARQAGAIVPGSGSANEPGTAAPADAAESLITRSLSALGLKLESRTLPLDRIVVDHAEKMPTPN